MMTVSPEAASSGSIVYFGGPDADSSGSPLDKFRKLLQATGVLDRLDEGDVVAVKLHMGELGNVRALRPIYARTVADMVREAGGLPFVADTTTLYKRTRHTHHGYLAAAAAHGYTPESLGCPVMIADLFRNSGTDVEVGEGALALSHVRIAQAFVEADAMVSITHPTFHPEFPLGGVVKNIGMGCTTKEGKITLHSRGAAPAYDEEKCVACFVCVRICPGEAFTRGDKKAVFDADKCVSCGDCIAHCRGGALRPAWGGGPIQEGTLDAVRATLSTFDPLKLAHLVVGTDITPGCDCGLSGLPVMCDIGYLSSTDVIALDRATWDLMHEAPLYPGGRLDEAELQEGVDRATHVYAHCDSERFWELAAKSRLGSLGYTLETI